VVPEWRRQRIVKTFGAAPEKPGDAGARESGIGAFMPMHDMLYLSHADWNDSISLTNYDQAWSMVHFLVHADGGRYQKPFAAFLRAVSGGQAWEEAWQASIGPADGFEERWREYWLKLPPNPTDDLYAQASVRSLTLFLARAGGQGQAFADFPAVVRAADAGQIKLSERNWLPQSVLLSALSEAARLHRDGYRFSLRLPEPTARNGKSLPQIVCHPPDGAEIVGRFTLNSNGVPRIFVDTQKSFAAPARGSSQAPARSR
jgi:hypothetical protein